MDENNLESPILSWQDPRPHNTPLDSLGLTALGSGAFFKYRDGRARLGIEVGLENVFALGSVSAFSLRCANIRNAYT